MIFIVEMSSASSRASVLGLSQGPKVMVLRDWVGKTPQGPCCDHMVLCIQVKTFIHLSTLSLAY